MPWSVEQNHPDCPGSEPWAVVNDESGEVEGCHADEGAAEAQRAALEASEEDASMDRHIAQTGDQWEVRDHAGAVLVTCATYDEAVRWLAAEAELQDGADDAGLLADRWMSEGGIGFPERTADGRDFSAVEWVLRDPGAVLVPLMLQTETEAGHFGAQLAGFLTRLWLDGDVPQAEGRFYDNAAGRQFRDMLQGGRRFGVSMDGGPGTEIGEIECMDDGEDADPFFCQDLRVEFVRYEIAGLTGTPFPAFPQANIVLAEAAGAGDAEGEPAQASDRAAAGVVASAPTRPPAAWFATPEPEAGDPLLVEQPHGAQAVPLTITDAGQVYGHLAAWGQCHIGYPGVCVTPPDSAAAYAHFHVGEVVCDDGSRFATGALTAGCDHAATHLRAADAQDHYAHSGVAWADVRVASGVYGPWVCGALRPDVTDEQLRVLRASSLSGDWRRIGGQLELVGALAVNVPGFPVAREALAASGLRALPVARVRARMDGADQVALVAAGVVRPCANCGQARTGQPAADPRLDRIEQVLATLELRTRHLVPAAVAAAADQLGRKRKRRMPADNGAR